jgi:hypothetical protein
MFRELRTPAKDDTTRDGACASLPRPAPNQFTLELSKAAQDRKHQPTVRGGGIGPQIPERSKTGFLTCDRVKNI